MLDKQELWFWLCNINGIGFKKIQNLLDYYGDVESIFYAKEDSLKQVKGLAEKDINYLSMVHKEEKIRHVYEQLAKAGVRFVIQENPEYPKQFRQVYDPPHGFYMKGKMPQENRPSVAIIGARNCTDYGKEIAIYFAKELAKAGVQIISGLAAGIDGYSHTGALQGGGYTLGILGSGIDVCYPESNYNVYHEMEIEGGILSEYGLHMRPIAGNFPRRNRLISALSDAILVIEARERSGSFITVDQGLEQGKDIFVIPGRITDELSIGCNRLARMGACVVCHPNDILQHFQMDISYQAEQQSHILMKFKNQLSQVELNVLKYLSLEPVYITKIAEKTTLSIGNLSEILIKLELQGLVKEIAKNYFIIQLSTS